MARTHFAKTPAGACLVFAMCGYDEELVKAVAAAIESDEGLGAKERERARAIMGPTSRWPTLRLSAQTTMRGLVVANEARAASSPELAIDGPEAAAHEAMARAFHDERPWLNQLAKSRGWALDGEPMRFDPVFSHGLSLSKGMRLEDASATGIMGSQQAFALFCPAKGGYLEMRSSQVVSLASPIGRARIFESAKAAKAFAAKKGVGKEVSVVEILVRAIRPHTLLEGADHTPLMAAIAACEAAEFEEMLRAREVDELRAKLAALEAGDPDSRGRRRGGL